MHHPGFMRDIIENPDDDAPRLIYADWLQEQGRAERAELIRLQCAMAALPWHDPGRRAMRPRAMELQSQFEEDWELEHGLEALKHDCYYFERGFLTCLTCHSPGQFLEMAEEVYQRMPLSWIVLTDTREREEGVDRPTEFVAMLQSPFFSRIRKLYMPDLVEEQDLLCFNELASPLSLQSLCIEECEISSEALMVLSSIQTLSDLQVLNLNEPCYYLEEDEDWDRCCAAIGQIISSPAFANLRELHCDAESTVRDSLGFELVQALTQAECTSRLSVLSLRSQGIGGKGLQLLAQWPLLGHLTRLHLDYSYPYRGDFGEVTTSKGIEALLHSEHWGQLEELSLAHTLTSLDELKMLAQAPNARTLRSLKVDLYGGDYSVRQKNEMVRFLTDSPYLAEIQELVLGDIRWSKKQKARLLEHFGDRIVLK